MFKPAILMLGSQITNSYSTGNLPKALIIFKLSLFNYSIESPLDMLGNSRPIKITPNTMTKSNI